MSTPEQDALERLLAAIGEVRAGCDEAIVVSGPLSDRPEALDQLNSLQRLAARALLKSVEQMQDLLARTLRLVLLVEQESVEGLSARAIADRAESLGVLPSSDHWSALVRLRNRLAHEYPLNRATQLARLKDAITAVAELKIIAVSAAAYIARRGFLS